MSPTIKDTQAKLSQRSQCTKITGPTKTIHIKEEGVLEEECATPLQRDAIRNGSS